MILFANLLKISKISNYFIKIYAPKTACSSLKEINTFEIEQEEKENDKNH